MNEEGSEQENEEDEEGEEEEEQEVDGEEDRIGNDDEENGNLRKKAASVAFKGVDSGTSNFSCVPVLGGGKGLTAFVSAIFLPSFNFIIDTGSAQRIFDNDYFSSSFPEEAPCSKSWSNMLLQDNVPLNSSAYRGFNVTLTTSDSPDCPRPDIVAECTPSIVEYFLLSIPPDSVAKDETVAKSVCALVTNAIIERQAFKWVLEEGKDGWKVMHVTLGVLV